jgi:hypothetical protein
VIVNGSCQNQNPTVSCVSPSYLYNGRCIAASANMPLGTAVPAPSIAYGGDVCQPYYGKGYCTDHIQNKIGRRPHVGSGPSSWPSTRDFNAIRPGIAVIFGNVAPPFGHVSFLENIEYDQQGRPAWLNISEMNYARGYKEAPHARECAVTNGFGEINYRRVSINDRNITGFWIP